MATAKFDEQHARWLLRYRVPSPKGTSLRYAYKRVFDLGYLGMDQAAKTRRHEEMEKLAAKLESDAREKAATPAENSAETRARAARQAAAQRIVDLMREHGITVDDLLPLYNAGR